MKRPEFEELNDLLTTEMGFERVPRVFAATDYYYREDLPEVKVELFNNKKLTFIMTDSTMLSLLINEVDRLHEVVKLMVEYGLAVSFSIRQSL